MLNVLGYSLSVFLLALGAYSACKIGRNWLYEYRTQKALRSWVRRTYGD